MNVLPVMSLSHAVKRDLSITPPLRVNITTKSSAYESKIGPNAAIPRLSIPNTTFLVTFGLLTM